MFKYLLILPLFLFPVLAMASQHEHNDSDEQTLYTLCHNTIDDDHDGFIDLLDSDCAQFRPVCLDGFHANEVFECVPNLPEDSICVLPQLLVDHVCTTPQPPECTPPQILNDQQICVDPPVTPPATLKVCKILEDSDGNVISGETGLTFTVPFLDATYEGAATGVPSSAVFNTPLTLETIFGDIQGQCVSRNVDFGRYYYGEENTGAWTTTYDDQVSGPATSLADLYPFNADLDAANDDFDGVINLSESNPIRTLLVLNKLNPVAPETCPEGQTGTPPNCVTPEPETPPVTQSGSSGGPSGGGSVISGPLSIGWINGNGAPTSCAPLLTKYLRYGAKNDSDEVKKLQKFLGLPQDGVFGIDTEVAVRMYQLAHAAQILSPWHLTTPSGLVYKTTRKAINEEYCKTVKEDAGPLIPWSQFFH